MLTSNGYTLDEATARLGELEPVPDAERGDRAALWDRLREHGYLFLRKALDPGDVHAFRRYFFDQLRDTGLVRSDTPPELGLTDYHEVDRGKLREILFRGIVPGAEYHDFCTQPAIKRWYKWFLGDNPFLHRRKILRYLRPFHTGIGTATQAHYDLVYLREGTDRVLSSWIPLGDCPVTRGGLIYLQQSHLRTLEDERTGRLQRPAASITADLPSLAEEYDARWLMADYEAGDMVVHSAHIVHAALDNVDPDSVIRLSTDIRYQRQADPIDWRWQSHWHDADGL